MTPTYGQKESERAAGEVECEDTLSLLSRRLKVPTSFFSYTQHLAVNERMAEDDDDDDDDCVVVVLVLVLVCRWLSG